MHCPYCFILLLLYSALERKQATVLSMTLRCVHCNEEEVVLGTALVGRSQWLCEKLKQVSARPPPVLKYRNVIISVQPNLRSSLEPTGIYVSVIHPNSEEVGSFCLGAQKS